MPDRMPFAAAFTPPRASSPATAPGMTIVSDEPEHGRLPAPDPTGRGGSRTIIRLARVADVKRP